MSWLKGSLEGLEFFMRPSREIQEHKHVIRNPVNSDKLSFIDFGLKGTGFEMKITLISDDIKSYQKKFIKLLKSQETQRLVHPYKGVVYIQVLSYTAHHSLESDIRSVSIDLVLLQVDSSRSYRVLETDLVGTAESLKEASKSFFEKAFNVVKQAKHVQDSATEAMTELRSSISDTIRSVKNGIASQIGKISQMNDQIQITLKTPKKISKQIGDVLGQIYNLSEDIVETFELQASLLSFSLTAETYDITPSREQEQDNAESLISLVKDISIANLSSSLVNFPFDSKEEAFKLRDTISNAIDDRISEVEDFTLISILKKLKGELYNTIDELEKLPEIYSQEIISSYPSLLFAHDFKGATYLEQEVLNRNTHRHPAFLQGSINYKVQS